jgi:peptide/nickel transport system substrate-binding protein
MRDLRFRQAMSLAINRDEINKLVFLGLARPQQMTIEINLIVSNESVVGPIGQRIVELTAQYWGEVGVRCIVRQQEVGAFNQAMPNGELPILIWPSEADLEIRSLSRRWSYSNNPKDPLGYAPEWGKWFAHQDWIREGRVGAEPPAGEEPPADIKENYANYLRYSSATSDREYMEYAAKFWDSLMKQLPVVGTVGNPPAPVIVTNRIKNVLPELPFSYESFLWQTPTIFQWYFTDTR